MPKSRKKASTSTKLSASAKRARLSRLPVLNGSLNDLPTEVIDLAFDHVPERVLLIVARVDRRLNGIALRKYYRNNRISFPTVHSWPSDHGQLLPLIHAIFIDVSKPTITTVNVRFLFKIGRSDDVEVQRVTELVEYCSTLSQSGLQNIILNGGQLWLGVDNRKPLHMQKYKRAWDNLVTAVQYSNCMSISISGMFPSFGDLSQDGLSEAQQLAIQAGGPSLRLISLHIGQMSRPSSFDAAFRAWALNTALRGNVLTSLVCEGHQDSFLADNVFFPRLNSLMVVKDTLSDLQKFLVRHPSLQTLTLRSGLPPSRGRIRDWLDDALPNLSTLSAETHHLKYFLKSANSLRSLRSLIWTNAAANETVWRHIAKRRLSLQIDLRLPDGHVELTKMIESAVVCNNITTLNVQTGYKALNPQSAVFNSLAQWMGTAFPKLISCQMSDSCGSTEKIQADAVRKLKEYCKDLSQVLLFCQSKSVEDWLKAKRRL